MRKNISKNIKMIKSLKLLLADASSTTAVKRGNHELHKESNIRESCRLAGPSVSPLWEVSFLCLERLEVFLPHSSSAVKWFTRKCIWNLPTLFLDRAGIRLACTALFLPEAPTVLVTLQTASAFWLKTLHPLPATHSTLCVLGFSAVWFQFFKKALKLFLLRI